MAATHHASEKLIERYQDLVRSIAIGVRRKVPPYIELEDLVAYGQIGLTEAARDFDPQRGNTFSTYAYYRIRGAIYDGVSKLCWTSRARYNRMRQVQAAEQSAVDSAQFHGASTDTAPHLVSGTGRTRRIDTQPEKLVMVYLAASATGDSDSVDLRLADPSAHTPQELVAHRESSEKVRNLIDGLPAREASLIRAVYFNGKSLQDAGTELGISKSWASRLHAKALQQLARELKLQGVDG